MQFSIDQEKQKTEKLQELLSKRQEAIEYLATIDGQIQELLQTSPPAESQQQSQTSRSSKKKSSPKQKRKYRTDRAGRIHNRMRLQDFMLEVLQDNQNQPLKTYEIAVAVARKGWKTSSNDPRSVIYQSLKDNKMFIKKGKGKDISWVARSNAIS